MNLNLIIPLKKIVLPSGKEVSIPKLGLKHYNILKDVKDINENMQLLTDSICPGLSSAEQDLVSLHLLEFNGKIKSKAERNGHTYHINDVYISQRLEFQYQGNTFYFKAPNKYEEFGTVDTLLNKCLVKVTDSAGNESEIPNFLKMPAFVVKWADDITNTLSIKGPDNIKGISDIIGLFQ